MTPSSQAGNAPAETDGTLGEIGEFGLIRRVATGRSQPAATIVGPGDDAAIVAAPDGRVVASTDVLVETVHFRLDWSTPEQVGRRAAAANLADIAAMGAVPTALLVGLACPANTPVATLTALADGLWAEAGVVGAGVVGGDVASSAQLMVAVTALGSLEAMTVEPPSGLMHSLAAIPSSQGRLDAVRTHVARHRRGYVGGVSVAAAGIAGALLLRRRLVAA